MVIFHPKSKSAHLHGVGPGHHHTHLAGGSHGETLVQILVKCEHAVVVPVKDLCGSSGRESGTALSAERGGWKKKGKERSSTNADGRQARTRIYSMCPRA